VRYVVIGAGAVGGALGGRLFQHGHEVVLAEGEAVLTAAGIAHAPAAELSGGFDVRPVGGETREGGSTWQSLARGTGSIETDFLNGEIVLLGREHGIATPVNEALQVLARQFAVEHREAGSLPALDLLDAVGLKV